MIKRIKGQLRRLRWWWRVKRCKHPEEGVNGHVTVMLLTGYRSTIRRGDIKPAASQTPLFWVCWETECRRCGKTSRQWGLSSKLGGPLAASVQRAMAGTSDGLTEEDFDGMMGDGVHTE